MADSKTPEKLLRLQTAAQENRLHYLLAWHDWSKRH